MLWQSWKFSSLCWIFDKWIRIMFAMGRAIIENLLQWNNFYVCNEQNSPCVSLFATKRTGKIEDWEVQTIEEETLKRNEIAQTFSRNVVFTLWGFCFKPQQKDSNVWVLKQQIKSKDTWWSTRVIAFSPKQQKHWEFYFMSALKAQKRHKRPF